MSLKWVAWAHQFATVFLHDHPSLQRIVQCHAAQAKLKKEEIIFELKKPRKNSRISLVLATEALSVGLDCPDFRRIILIGPPSSIEQYVQETGRGGRDGLPSTAILLINKYDTSTGKIHLSSSMREFCSLTTCRRKYILDYFGFSSQSYTSCI